MKLKDLPNGAYFRYASSDMLIYQKRVGPYREGKGKKQVVMVERQYWRSEVDHVWRSCYSLAEERPPDALVVRVRMEVYPHDEKEIIREQELL